MSTFDALVDADEPFEGFGEILTTSPKLEACLRDGAAAARDRIQSTFARDLADPSQVPLELDLVIAEMWKTGWVPQIGNLNLFTTDFGLVLADAILELLSGTPTFRSGIDMTHFSIFWKKRKLEAFPFHKVLKCLQSREGETITSFLSGLSHRLEGNKYSLGEPGAV